MEKAATAEKEFRGKATRRPTSFWRCRCAYWARLGFDPAIVRPAWCAGLRTIVRALALSVVFAGTTTGQARSDDREKMELAARQLVGAQLPSGLFPYDFNFLTGVGTDTSRLTSPMLARQAGTTYVLARYHMRAPDAALRHSIEIALESLAGYGLPITRSTFQRIVQKTRILSVSTGRRTIQRNFNWLGLLYQAGGEGKVISPDGTYEAAWLGISALTLLAELEYSRTTRDNRFASLRKGLVHGMLALEAPGHGFRAAPHFLGEEAYFNAQGWLALAVYSARFPRDGNVTEVLPRIENYLMGHYSRRWSAQFYSWGMMAAETRYAKTKDRKFVRFVRSQTSKFLSRLHKNRLEEETLQCASVEGLGVAARVLELYGSGDDDLIRRIRGVIDLAMMEAEKLQIRPGQDRLHLRDGAYLGSPRLKEFVGAFLAGPTRPFTQIDLTAHCLSAMMILNRSPGG